MEKTNLIAVVCIQGTLSKVSQKVLRFLEKALGSNDRLGKENVIRCSRDHASNA